MSLCIVTVWNAIASVGWYIIAVVISLWLASPYIREKYTSWKLKKDEQEYAAKYHKSKYKYEKIATLHVYYMLISFLSFVRRS